MAAVELLGDDQTEHRVAEELQPLVGRKTAVLVGEGAMGDGAHDELVVGDRAEEIDEGREVLVRTGPPGHHSLASASVTASPTVCSRSSSSSAMRNSPGAYGASRSSTISATSTRASESAWRSAKSLSQVTDVGSRSRTVATASRTTANTSSRPGRCPAAVPVAFTAPPLSLRHPAPALLLRSPRQTGAGASARDEPGHRLGHARDNLLADGAR